MRITKNAKLRCQQCGIKEDFLQIIMQKGNIKITWWSNCPFPFIGSSLQITINQEAEDI